MFYSADAEVVSKFHRDGYVELRPLSNTAQSSNNSDERCNRKRPIDDDLKLIDYGRVLTTIWAEYTKTLCRALAAGEAAQLLTYDASENLVTRYPGFITRVGGRVDLDVTECLQEPLRFGPDNAPWMDAVKAILGCGGGDNRLSSVSGAGADPSLEGGRQLSATRPMNNGGGGGGSDSGRRVENIRSIEKRYGFGCVLSKPGDKVQNWHQDGDTGWEVDKAARTVIVFLVPVHVTHDQGPLEIIKSSNTVTSGPGQREGELPPSLAATAPGKRDSFLFESFDPGTVVIMDYRSWHRGLPNSSGSMRPMIYARYRAVEPNAVGSKADGTKPKRRVKPEAM
mmetsp:Transcript_19387/g.31388  ORF Transcript_19387/g.31388 Transcript_19387/m.31388 type:complete len:339 (-) Transcript_19387:166-1182(-)|eukprot:CAMPEP_0198686664 /NCGR_PEP_ID=MMETSP1468-20131203/15180_1 /TAXON_ID=1461545 /ORGANISM="Mantoniella sp, Strain CCMP1436" /LENGTH=338 /DNA_ID=CAMNT_0044432911 /DNA_START=87 /DNA_END=1103 /DNA_ORIENTATION=+